MKVLLVPLGSNAHSLLDGPEVESIRRRLKQASISYDRLVLEQGVLDINAGPGGSSAIRHGDQNAEFQTAETRKRAEAGGFIISLGPENAVGVEPTEMRTFLQSTNSIAWSATLEPFDRELPPDADWIVYDNLPKSEAISRTADDWSEIDSRNPALRDSVPKQFVRSLIIKNANTDLSVGAHARVAVMQDTMHQQVVATRLDDAEGWRGRGFALPVILPEVGSLPWEMVAEIRKHKAMEAFRAALADVEEYALDLAVGGDLETAVHRAFERYQAQAQPKLANLPSVGKEVLVEMGIGCLAGLATMGMTGPIAIPTGAALGVTPLVVRGAVDAYRSKRRRWDTVYNAIVELADGAPTKSGTSSG